DDGGRGRGGAVHVTRRAGCGPAVRVGGVQLTARPGMLKQSTGWAVAALVAAFLAGGLVSWGVASHAGHGRGSGGPGWGRSGRGGGGPGGFLKRELELTPAQEDSVQAIFARHRPQMEAFGR